MDSIVDTFFPLIDFIESESDDVDAFLADPLQDYRKRNRGDNTERELARADHTQVYDFQIPAFIEQHLPLCLSRRMKSYLSVSQVRAEHTGRPPNPNASLRQKQGAEDGLYNRGKMLKRIAVTRKIITGMSRLLMPKMDVVNGLRKRVRDEIKATSVVEAGQRHDISIYLGDLQGR